MVVKVVSCIITWTVIRQPCVRFQVGPCGIGSRKDWQIFFWLHSLARRVAQFPTVAVLSTIYNRANGVSENSCIMHLNLSNTLVKAVWFSSVDSTYTGLRIYVFTHLQVSYWGTTRFVCFVLTVVGYILIFRWTFIQTRQRWCYRKRPSGGCELALHVVYN